jgi:hypothetical protein
LVYRASWFSQTEIGLRQNLAKAVALSFLHVSNPTWIELVIGMNPPQAFPDGQSA